MELVDGKKAFPIGETITRVNLMITKLVLELFVCSELFSRLTAGQRGCMYYCQCLSVVIYLQRSEVSAKLYKWLHSPRPSCIALLFFYVYISAIVDIHMLKLVITCICTHLKPVPFSSSLSAWEQG